MYPIPNYPGYFLTENNQVIGKNGRALSFTQIPNGPYQFACVMQGERGAAKRTVLYLHRAIALVHVKGYFDGAHVDHIDGNPHNNNPTNLQWLTRSQNMLKMKTGSDRAPHKSEKKWTTALGLTVEAWRALVPDERRRLIKTFRENSK